MKRIILTIVVSAIQFLCCMAQTSAQWETLKGKLDGYVAAISTEPLETQAEEVDFLIQACNDTSLRRQTALYLYDKFANSKLMGSENIIIHIFDKWFSDGSISMRSEEELFLARMNADINRASLIGCKAPELFAADTSGRPAEVVWNEDGRDKVLFFYDTRCAKCKIESILMRNMLEAEDFEADIITFCTGQAKTEMIRFINENLDFNPSVKRNVTHLWDPDGSSGFTMLYGVIQTPRMFLVGGDGIIVGRTLDTGALSKLLSLRRPVETIYGSDASTDLFDSVFKECEDTMSCRKLSETADYIIRATECTGLGIRKQLLGDLLYYVAGQKKPGFRCGTSELVRKYYLSRPDLWNSADDSLKVISLASFLDEMTSRTPEGSMLPKVKAHVTILKTGKAKERIIDLSRQKSATILFHTQGCRICESEIEAAYTMSGSRRLKKVILVDMDLLFNTFPEEASLLLDTFDLSALPFIIRTDAKGAVCGKYLSLVGE